MSAGIARAEREDEMKLSENETLVLLAVSEKCDDETFFVAPYSGDTIRVNVARYDDCGRLQQETLRELFVYGSICNSFRSLERKGLIRRPITSLSQPHVCEMTEAGLLHVEYYREGKGVRL